MRPPAQQRVMSQVSVPYRSSLSSSPYSLYSSFFFQDVPWALKGVKRYPTYSQAFNCHYSQHWASHKSPQSPFTTAKLSFCNWSLDSVIVTARPVSKTTVLAYPLGPMTKLKIPCMNSLNFCQKAVDDPAYVALRAKVLTAKLEDLKSIWWKEGAASLSHPLTATMVCVLIK